ncbi:aminoglycoside phosphotransferase family protein [uncultured Roseibium sp.]|uniref:aminoglycoside phosphotransferase family protein n=1 Tax=uncultured Roseibium sp. TaxID=1936171 RepID=UPI0026122A38|nr:aminoglycoside phosphotransferase family protein [uncultured Roseibium sp.]
MRGWPCRSGEAVILLSPDALNVGAMMHANEIFSDETTTKRLIDEQVPDLAGLPVKKLETSGTDNALYRVGAEHVMRLPRRPEAVPLLAKEIAWLPHFGGLPLEVPVVCYTCRASRVFAHDFAVFKWINGEPAAIEAVGNVEQAARDLGGFLKDLHRVITAGAPAAGSGNHNRGVALGELNEKTYRSIEILEDEIDAAAANALWLDACHNPFQGPGSWLHGDLKADNMLTRNGRLCAVLDWGLCAVGDPAADFAAAWSFVAPEARDAFREAAGADDAQWRRAKGWALYGAVIALSYYRGGKNEPLCRQCRQTLKRLGLVRAGG